MVYCGSSPTYQGYKRVKNVKRKDVCHLQQDRQVVRFSSRLILLNVSIITNPQRREEQTYRNKKKKRKSEQKKRERFNQSITYN